MRFDDRLMTVLEQPATDRHDRAVRWRQLVDLVARSAGQSGNPLVERALATIRTDGAQVDAGLRAAAARAIAALPLPFELIALFASDTLAVSAPILAAARLERDEWLALLGTADEETRNFIRTLHPDLPEQAPAAPGPPADEPLVEDAPPAPPEQVPSISDVVARIERLRRSRRPERPRRPASLQVGAEPGAPALFRWECGPSGEISWVEGAPRGALVGRSIARAEEDGVDQDVERAFAMRAPFHDAELNIGGEGLVSGHWKMSGVPAFEPTDGRFAGYRGIALRESAAQAAGGGVGPLADPDSLRELVHEIKTPLNAIMGFAEIIDGQYLGPADRHYRSRAAEIVAQAKLLLSAIDDLDFAAKLQADSGRAGGGTDLGMLLEQVVARVQQESPADAPRMSHAVDTTRRRCALEPALAERLVTRFCTSLLGAAAGAPSILVHLDSEPGRCLLWAARPKANGSGEDPVSASFGLRLVRGLARIAGGDLVESPTRVALALPEL